MVCPLCGQDLESNKCPRKTNYANSYSMNEYELGDSYEEIYISEYRVFIDKLNSISTISKIEPTFLRLPRTNVRVPHLNKEIILKLNYILDSSSILSDIDFLIAFS